MISNYIIREKITNIKEQKTALVKEKQSLSEQIRSLGIKKQAAWKIKTGYSEVVIPGLELRETWAKRITKIEAEISILNTELSKLFDLQESDINKSLINIFKEIFTTDQLREIRIEAERRMRGESSIRVSFSVKDAMDSKVEFTKTKKQVKEYAQKLVDVRATITNIIQDGCEQFDESKFLKVMSPLNRMTLPIDYITKIKREHFIK